MKSVFLDTNILLDLLTRPQFSAEVKSILEKGDYHNIEYCISFLSMANFAYIIRKNNMNEIYAFLNFLCDEFKVLKNDVENIRRAMNWRAKDLEDAIQYETAIDGECDCIITRNKKDFDFSQIPVYTPEEFLKKL